MYYQTIQKGLALVGERYLADRELSAMENYSKTFGRRLAVYNSLKTEEEKIIRETLGKFTQTDAEFMEKYRPICMRDLHFLMQMVAHAVVTDNQAGFTDSLLWLQNILRSVHKESHATKGYKILQAVVASHLSPESMALVDPYFQQMIEMMGLPV